MKHQGWLPSYYQVAVVKSADGYFEREGSKEKCVVVVYRSDTERLECEREKGTKEGNRTETEEFEECTRLFVFFGT